MAWDSEMLTILRVLVSDPDATTFSDSSLIKTIVVAAFQVNLELPFSEGYVVNIDNETIAPDPTIDSRNENFINLVCIKAACLIDRGGAMAAANKAVSFKDGSASADLRGIFAGKFQLLKQGWCAVYNDAKTEYLTTQSGGVAGAAIMTPFRLYANNRGYYSIGR